MKLTFAADALEGITEQLRIDSGKNHGGYHVADRLASASHPGPGAGSPLRGRLCDGL
ncbi:hypothetical protein [Streptomyces sp. NBC_00443]|uniref:hypothetical protein n=1 Tax=Streptomyces sp. NBC_00443 TaxID=2975743 RepID=UPI002E242487